MSVDIIRYDGGYEKYIYLVFFFEQKQAYKVRIRDWSSDVFSCDLFDFLGDDVGVVVSASVALVAAVADLADDHELVALLLVIGDRLAEAVEGLDLVELVVGLGVAVAVLLDLPVLDHRLRGDEAEARASFAVGAEAADVRGDAAREKNLVHGVAPFALRQRAEPRGK